MSENPAVNAMNLAPRCTATSKRTGLRCQAPAVRGKRVCRCHGAYAGAPRGSAHGRYVHGQRTIQAQAERLYERLLLNEAGDLLSAMLQARLKKIVENGRRDCLNDRQDRLFENGPNVDGIRNAF
ncbi:MAG TPA: hypothetical protein VGN97_22715 [Mesorhizobium sp.]|nr:hypothetical protein [Mesorhizobium sp.]